MNFGCHIKTLLFIGFFSPIILLGFSFKLCKKFSESQIKTNHEASIVH